MPRLLLLGCALWILTSCKAHHPALTPTMRPVNTTTRVYPSGLRIIVEQSAGTERVAIALLVGAGFGQDDKGKEGTAHFVEHLAFRSKPFTRLTLWDELDFAGLASDSEIANAMTELHSTTYYAITPANRLGDVLPLMASTAVRPLVNVEPAVIEVERRVVNAELAGASKHASRRYISAVAKVVFPPEAPEVRSGAENADSLAAITKGDLETFVARNYVPQRTTLVLVGDVDPAQVDAFARKAFPPQWLEAAAPIVPATLADRQPLDTPPSEPPARDEFPPMVPSAGKLRELIFAWAVPGTETPGGNATTLLKPGWHGSHRPMREFGVTGYWVDVVEAPTQSMFLLHAVLDDTADPRVVRSEFEGHLDFHFTYVGASAVRALALEEVIEEADLIGHACSRARHAFATGNTALRKIGVSSEGFDRLEMTMTGFLSWDRAREVLLVPEPLTTRLGAPAAALPAVNRNLSVPPEMLRAVALGPPLPEKKEFTLENGLRVVLSRRVSVPLATVTLTFPIGARDTTRLAANWTDATLDWNRGKDRAFWHVGEPTFTVTADETQVRFTHFSWELPVVLDVVGHNLPPLVSWDYVKGLDFYTLADQREARRRTERNADMLVRDSLAREGLLRSVLPPGSAQLELRSDETHDAERPQFVDFIDRVFQPKGAVLVVDGDFEFASVEAEVRELFGDWSARQPEARPRRELGPIPQRPVEPIVVPQPRVNQTAVRIACRLPAATTAELRGGNQLLAVALQVVLEDEVRQRLGGTYGVTVRSSDQRGEENLLWLETSLDAAGNGEALSKFLERFDALDGAVWDEQTIDYARWRLAKSVMGSTTTSSSVASFVGRELVHGASLDDAAKLPLALATTPTKFVDAAWEQCSDTLALQLTGDPTLIQKALGERRARRNPPVRRSP
ncbi:MAG: insulinase family protein [Archangium sp.]